MHIHVSKFLEVEVSKDGKCIDVKTDANEQRLIASCVPREVGEFCLFTVKIFFVNSVPIKVNKFVCRAQHTTVYYSAAQLYTTANVQPSTVSQDQDYISISVKGVGT